MARRFMFKVIIPILVLLATLFYAKHLIETGPEARKKPYVERVPVVEIQPLKAQSYTVTITASGTVKAGTQTNLVSEVSGRVLSISKQFQEGSFFDKGITLLTIDQENYQNALAVVNSDVAASQASLSQIDEEEKTTKRSYQLAQKNLMLGKKEVNRLQALWNKKVIARSALDIEHQKTNQLQQKLEDLQGRLNSFKSRKLATLAKINAARARQKQEQLNLKRTKIITPYAGRVLEKKVDIGQFVSMGSVLGKVYSTQYVEVALPLSLNRYELLGFPETFKNKAAGQNNFPKVIFSNPNSLQTSEWKGQVLRTTAALDSDSRQITVIARIDHPFDAQAGVTTPLRIGQYVEAKIKGKTFHHVYVLPPVAVRQNKEILLLDDGKISVVPVNVVWNDQGKVVVAVDKPIDGKQLITTSLNQAVDGMKAVTVEQQTQALKAQQANKNADKKHRQKEPQ